MTIQSDNSLDKAVVDPETNPDGLLRSGFEDEQPEPDFDERI